MSAHLYLLTTATQQPGSKSGSSCWNLTLEISVDVRFPHQSIGVGCGRGHVGSVLGVARSLHWAESSSQPSLGGLSDCLRVWHDMNLFDISWKNWCFYGRALCWHLTYLNFMLCLPWMLGVIGAKGTLRAMVVYFFGRPTALAKSIRLLTPPTNHQNASVSYPNHQIFKYLFTPLCSLDCPHNICAQQYPQRL